MPTNMLPLPSFNRLDELLSYDPESGELRWKTRRLGTKANGIAGSIRTSKKGRREWKIKIDGTTYLSCRVIWMLHFHEDPGSLTIDHIDRNPLNNCITNLRLADMHEQNLNTCHTSASTATRYIGVMMDSHKNCGGRPRWCGKIRISRHLYSFGSAGVNSINDPPPDWLIARAACLFAMRDDPKISDEALIREITR